MTVEVIVNKKQHDFKWQDDTDKRDGKIVTDADIMKEWFELKSPYASFSSTLRV